MPYKTNKALPAAVRKHLPGPAQTIYREAYNSAYKTYAKSARREEIAHRTAWTAVKTKYRKKGDKWVKK